jgi:D-3-phosphoglycerate dehydrogenase
VDVAILDDYLDTMRTLECFEKLAGHRVTVLTEHVDDVGELAARLQETEALVLIRERTRIGADLLERLPHLRLISQRSAYPHIDVEACTRHGVTVCSKVGGALPSYSTAELTWGLILAAMRRIPQQDRALREGRWQTEMGSLLLGKTLGLWGYGRIAPVVAGFGRAFGMRVLVWARPESCERAIADGYEAAPDKETFLATSDIVSLHMRLVDATRGIVGPADLALMKPTALIVNTSRAGLIEPGALAAALRAGRPGLAAVDVYEQEPLPAGGDPLLELPGVVATPHLGYVTREEWELQFGEVFDQINAFAAGEPINVVNP